MPQLACAQAVHGGAADAKALRRLPGNEVLKPYAGELLRVCLAVLAADNEENGLVCLRIAFDLHKAFRPALVDQVAPFLDFARKARSLLSSFRLPGRVWQRLT